MKKIAWIIAALVVVAGGLAFYYHFMPARMTRDNIRDAIMAEERLDRAPGTDPTELAEEVDLGPIPEVDAMADATFVELDEPPLTEDGETPDVFHVRFECSNGNFVVEVHRAWAPLGAQRLHELISEGVYDEARFFRVVPDFVVQWGIPADPEEAAKWRTNTIADDPVLQSNERGMLTFATSGPNSRTSQVFINFNDNTNLDLMGFAPVGRVVKGMDVVDSINPEYGQSVNQGRIQHQGNEYLTEEYPNMDYIERAVFVTSADEGANASD